MALITCPECGNSVSDRAESCPHCGNPINQSYRPQQQPQYYPSNNNNGQSNWLVPALIAAVVALAAILGFIAYNNSKSSDNSLTSASGYASVEPSQSTMFAEQPQQAAAEQNEGSLTHPKAQVDTRYRDPSSLVRYCISTINYGYVNVRRRPTTKSGVVKVLYDGDSFYGHPMSSTNWIEYVQDGQVIGYVREDCVRKPGQSRYFYD